jgi:hypothetical protein
MGRPRNPPPTPDVEPWDRPAVTKQIDAILASVEAPPVDADVRRLLARQYWRREKYFGGDKGETTLLLRTIIESTNGPEALVEPIVSAVSLCMRPEWTKKGLAWIEAFDRIPLVSLLQTMRDLFGEKDARQHLETVIRRKLYAILQAATAKPAKAKLPPKPPLSVTRVPQIEKAISFGVELQAVRAAIVCNKLYSREVRKRFPDVDPITASESMRVARVYAARPEIYRAAAWAVLIELASPKMSATVRQAMEAKILAGETVTAKQIRKARGRLKGGSLKRQHDQPTARMAA